MNKKIIFTLFVLFICFSLSGCKEDTPEQVHNHDWAEATVEVAATCTSEGKKVRTCKTCEESEEIVINKTAHKYVELSSDIVSDCLSEGKIIYECSTCKDKFEITLQATGHTVVIDEAVAPTCTETGLTKGSHCSSCNEVISAPAEIPALGHAWGEEIYDSSTVKKVCQCCNATQTFDLSVPTHTLTITGEIQPTCTKEGLSGVAVCDQCNKVVFENEVLNALGHNYVNGECIECKTAEPKDGMKFKLINGEYYLQDVGTVSSRTINVPLMYNNQYVVGILDGAFDRAEYVHTIYLPHSITTIEDGAFLKCKMLQNTIVDYRNEYFETIDKCLVESETMTLLVGGANALIPDGIKHIAPNAYKNHIGVTYIKIPSSVETIGKDAFAGCPNILIIEVDSKNKLYYSKDNCLLDKDTNVLLLGCKTSIIPEGTEVIGSGAFAGCEMINEIKIPNSVTTIMPGAYSGCIFVTKLEISASVTELTGAFEGLKNLTTIIIDENNPRYEVVNNCIMEKKTKTLVLSNSNAFIPEGTIIIGEGAFAGNIGIINIEIPATVTTIEARAFADCIALEKVTFNNGLVTIGKEAFKNCGKLESFKIPRSITTIEENAFEGCKSLIRLEIPTSVTTIGEEAFKGCDTLIICGEAKTKPAGWHENYNPDGRPEFWNIYILK